VFFGTKPSLLHLQLESVFRYNLEQFLNTEDNIQNASIKQAIKVAMSADMSGIVK
jgi:hypothetical protein